MNIGIFLPLDKGLQKDLGKWRPIWIQINNKTATVLSILTRVRGHHVVRSKEAIAPGTKFLGVPRIKSLDVRLSAYPVVFFPFCWIPSSKSPCPHLLSPSTIPSLLILPTSLSLVSLWSPGPSSPCLSINWPVMTSPPHMLVIPGWSRQQTTHCLGLWNGGWLPGCHSLIVAWMKHIRAPVASIDHWSS